MEPPPGFPHGDTQVYVGFLLLQGETTILGSSAGHVGTFRVTQTPPCPELPVLHSVVFL